MSPEDKVQELAASKPAAKSARTRSATEARLEKLGLRTLADFVLHVPLRYEDETTIVPISSLRFGMTAQIEGVVTDCSVRIRPRRVLEVAVQDSSGNLNLRFLNFYPSHLKALAVGQTVRVRGEVRHGSFGVEMVHPSFYAVVPGSPLPERLTPVYPTTAGISQALLRKRIASALEQVDLTDPLPEPIRSQLRFPSFAAAVRELHAPPPGTDLAALEERSHPAWQRLKFDELLAQQLSLKRALALRRQQLAVPLAPAHLAEQLLAQLPFALTGAQQRVWQEISHDLTRTFPMQRLLQGDVGSGKTVVAALAATQAIASGYQAALMAPTEILAEQHYRKLSSWLTPLGIEVVWLTGSLGASAKRNAQTRLASGEPLLAVGTQALIQTAVRMERLALAVVDEQHRFGVQQRLALQAGIASDDAQSPPLVCHQLMMSATPIPRTLAMTFYADLEVSVIDQLPPGRSPVLTRLIDDNRRGEVTERVHAAAQAGRQVYWVCPLIEESEALQLQTAIDTHMQLQQELAPLRVGLVHGRLKSTEKAQVMQAFTAGELDVLVATTVIEVGVDVPNASLMIIEHAERFGLAQLHQLRGRVGRGTVQSVCILLFHAPLAPMAKERLRALRESNDGFELARCDLAIRGPGEFLGQRQSGLALLRFADLTQDTELIESAVKLADHILANQPEVAARYDALWMAGREQYLKA